MLAGGEGDIAGQDLRHAEFFKGADLLIHDAQYTAAEYPSKIGWGHSSVEYAVKLGQHALVKRLALTHHDPLRDDDSIDRVLAGIKDCLQTAAVPLRVFAASEGDIIEVQPSRSEPSEHSTEQFPAMTPIKSALAERSILLGVADPDLAAGLSDVIRAEGIRIDFFSAVDEARELINTNRPSLVILEHNKAGVDGIATCRAIRQIEDDETPVIKVATQEDPGAASFVSDWLIKPFTSSYARTKIRAWVLRTECRWLRAAIPANEKQRISSLRDLNILDTAPEERFDRITRIAAALFDVPMAVISLVDENRQWFKSCVGSNAKETPRDVAFCAHVVYNCEPMIVSDAFQDARFAD
jgi:CheY-like chemotaxis protein